MLYLFSVFGNLSCFLFIFQILSSVLEMIPFPSGIRLAVLASRKEVIDFEKWLSSNLNSYKDVFFEVIASPSQVSMIT